MTRLVIFDLDGTLLNTIGDLASNCNAALHRHSLPQHADTDYRRFVGNGIMRLVERSLPEDMRTAETIAAVRQDFIELYTANIDTHTLPYDGIPELLVKLSGMGITIAVASNKFQSGTEKLIQRFFPSIPLAVVLGQREGVPLKPDPTIVKEILLKTNISAEDTLYIGDSGIDMQTAVNAGVRSVGVTWGFRSRNELEQSGACHIVNRPAEIANLL